MKKSSQLFFLSLYRCFCIVLESECYYSWSLILFFFVV